MKIHERIKKANDILKIETPWYVYRFIGRAELSDTGVRFDGDEYNDFGTVEEIHQVIAWLIDQFDYKAPKKGK